MDIQSSVLPYQLFNETAIEANKWTMVARSSIVLHIQSSYSLTYMLQVAEYKLIHYPCYIQDRKPTSFRKGESNNNVQRYQSKSTSCIDQITFCFCLVSSDSSYTSFLLSFSQNWKQGF